VSYMRSESGYRVTAQTAITSLKCSIIHIRGSSRASRDRSVKSSLGSGTLDLCTIAPNSNTTLRVSRLLSFLPRALRTSLYTVLISSFHARFLLLRSYLLFCSQPLVFCFLVLFWMLLYPLSFCYHCLVGRGTYFSFFMILPFSSTRASALSFFLKALSSFLLNFLSLRSSLSAVAGLVGIVSS
jgi:hypothetical protein